jgi:hypothetical protein
MTNPSLLLSEDADLLLAGVERDPEYPHYSQATFRRKLRLANRRERLSEMQIEPLSEATIYLQRIELGRIICQAGLTRRQTEVFCARADGDSWVDIGRRHGHTKQGAYQIFKQAIKKIERARKNNPFRDLYQVYREEVRRFSPRRMGR